MPDVKVANLLVAARDDLADIDRQIQELQNARIAAEATIAAYERVASVSTTKLSIIAPQRHRLTQALAAAAPQASTISVQPKPRAAPGSWVRVFATLAKQDAFTYDDVVAAAGELKIETTKPSARVRVSKFKDNGYLERVEEGVYRATKAGEKFFVGH